MKQIPLITWARYAFITGLVITLIGLLPTVWFPFQLGKLVVFGIVATVAGALFFFGGGAGGVFGKRGLLPALLVLLLPVSYALSYAFSIDRSVGLTGYSIEGDTVVFVGLCTLAFLFSFFLFRRSSTVQSLLTAVGVSAVVAVLFQFVSILFGTHVLMFSVFSDPSVNLVGKWNDIGLLAGAALAALLVWAEALPRSTRQRIQAACAAAVLVLFIAIVQNALIWGLLLAVIVGIALWLGLSGSLRTSHEGGRLNWNRLPVLSGVVALVSVAFLLWGSFFQSGLVRLFPVSSLEVRPSFSSTLDIVRASHGDSLGKFLVGTGPQTFSTDWFMHKPVQINQTQFWNLDFNVGYSLIVTAVATVGALGALAWVMPLLLVLFGLVRMLRSTSSPEEKALALTLGMTSVYLWLAAIFYVPSQNLILLAFILSGASLAYSYASSEAQGMGAMMQRLRVFFSLCVLAGVVVLVFVSFVLVRRFVAEMYTNQTLIALQQKNTDQASLSAQQALKIERTGDTLQVQILAATAALTAVAQATSTPSKDVQAAFAAQAQAAVAVGQEAIAKNPSDYRPYFLLAKLYDLLAQLGVQGAYETATQLYVASLSHNPTNPQIPLTAARLAAIRGDKELTNNALSKALELKNDYTDAILFAVQLYVANKDIKNAIVAAQAAVKSAPGVASIWFELGLLYYSDNNFTGAIQALEQAITLEANYANAKYFLGLSYATQNRTADAIKLFKDLASSNPDNAEVKLILSNLEQGKKPFDGAQPPVTTSPEDRSTAPIQQ